jgi:hypothetical protein
MRDVVEDAKGELGGLDFKAIGKHAAEEEFSRPRVEIWPDPYYDEWTDWVQRHERKRSGNPVDMCEIMKGMGASPLCPVGYH